jgi:hypothetical protein
MRRGTVVLVTRAFAVGIFVTCGALQCALGAEERVIVDQGWSDNANMGHDYGNAALQPEDRMALIEYMKAIGGHHEGSKIVP